MEDNVAMLFTASLTDIQRRELTTALQQTVQDRAIQSTPVSPDVDIRLLSGRTRERIYDKKRHSLFQPTRFPW